MRITFLADKLNLSKGGSNYSLDLTAAKLSQRGHEVTVVTLNFIHDNDLPSQRPYSIVQDPVRKGGSKLRRARQIYSKLDRYDSGSDVLHVFNPAILPITGHYGSRRGRSPIVGRLNTYDIFCSNLSRMTATCFESCTIGRKFAHHDKNITGRLVKIPEYVFNTYPLPRLLSGADRLFALSPSVKHIYDSIGVDSELIEVVPNFYDPNFADSSDSRDLFDSTSFSVLYVGRLGKEKGVDLIIDSLNHVKEPSDFRIEIVGEGPYREALEQAAMRSPVPNRIQFHGWIENSDLPDFYKSADVFVHPGRWPEPFGRTILEAMQCGCYPIVSDIGAPPWIIGDSGSIFKRGNSRNLARNLELAKNNVDTQRDFSKRLRKFDPESVVNRIEVLYESVVSESA